MPRPWFGIEHGKQWPWWCGITAVGLVLIAISAGHDPNGGALAAIGGLMVYGAVIAGSFVMGRRLARHKNRSVGLATLWVVLGGWFAVLVYALISPASEAAPAEREVRRLEAEVRRLELQRQFYD
jgi:drug/metabolite transporter (DMT)-like permease